MSPDPEKKAMAIYAIAHAIAEKAHAGQFRRLPDGRPYIEHCKDVAALMPTWELKTVAILHDSIEDSGGKVTRESLLADGIPTDIVNAVVAMTKPDDTKDYLGYVRGQVKPDPLATKVKLADNYVNMRDMLTGFVARKKGDKKCAERLHKYALSIALLTDPGEPNQARKKGRKTR